MIAAYLLLAVHSGDELGSLGDSTAWAGLTRRWADWGRQSPSAVSLGVLQPCHGVGVIGDWSRTRGRLGLRETQDLASGVWGDTGLVVVGRGTWGR